MLAIVPRLLRNKPTLQPGEWWIQYVHTRGLQIRCLDSDIVQPLRLAPGDHFTLPELDALKFLAIIQVQYPALIDTFAIIDRCPTTDNYTGDLYDGARHNESR